MSYSILAPEQLQLLLPATKEIPLTKGKIAIVDAADFDWLMQWKWRVDIRPYTSYALRNHWYDGKQHIVYMHRVILGAKPGEEIDHCNNDGLNNTRANLRFCAHSDNQHNQRLIRSNNTSGYKGVAKGSAKGEWQVHIQDKGKRLYLGKYSDLVEAARVYDAAARELHGEFAKLNFRLEK